MEIPGWFTEPLGDHLRVLEFFVGEDTIPQPLGDLHVIHSISRVGVDPLTPL